MFIFKTNMCTYSIHNGTMKHVGEIEIVLFCGTVCVYVLVLYIRSKKEVLWKFVILSHSVTHNW